MANSPVVWRLKSGADRRFRAGHPWVYSNEIMESPKGLEPGAPVELRDAGGKFLARGYGNPQSLIAFRALTRKESETAPASAEAVGAALVRAAKLRVAQGLGQRSFRLCFGEADSLPGLVIDRYRLEGAQVFVIQAHTAGADRMLPAIEESLRAVVAELRDIEWERTGILVNNEIPIRKLEGLQPEPPRVVKAVSGVDPARTKIRIASAVKEFLEFEVDLLQGQKTGFFLDQAANVELAIARLSKLVPQDSAQPVRILDLFCYVGQWGAQLARAFQAQGRKVEVTAVDASATALELAKKNIEAQGARCETLKMDIIEGLAKLPATHYDIVISDPPALIKGRKDIPVGTHAYLQLNTEVFRIVRNGGAVVACSCSGLLEEDSFLKTLSKASYRNRRSVRWVARGTQAADHPMLIEFPEGRYLKAWIGFVE